MEMTDKVIGMIQQSPLWAELNAKAKVLYEKHGRTPSEEEYEALRNIIICRVMIEEPAIREVMARETYEYFRKEAGV